MPTRFSGNLLSMIHFPRYILPTVITAAFILTGFMWLREEVTTRIYRDKLQVLAAEYETLASHYNDAVRQSAITELEVKDNSLSVLIRTADGTIRRLATPYDPSGEIYVDYLVGEGRIWIRRIFDARTPPQDAMVIDPVWESVDWESPSLNYGKAIYRSLKPGIWSIQVSGNGSLSLEPVEHTQMARLESTPEIRSYEEFQLDLKQEAENITFQDFLDICLSPFRD